jgi:hypothetical protein
MNNVSRLKRLEGYRAGKPPRTWVLVNGEPEPEGVAEGDTVVWVASESARTLTQRLVDGEGTL